MARRFGIAGRLFLAFAGIAGLSLAAGGVGWWTLSNIEEAQRTVAERALPAVADARAVAALSARLIARGPLLANAAGQAERQAVAEDLFAQVERLEGLLDRIASYAAPDGGEATARVAAAESPVRPRWDMVIARRSSSSPPPTERGAVSSVARANCPPRPSASPG